MGRTRWTVGLVGLLLASGGVACGGGDEGVPDAERARLDREMDTALEEEPTAEPELRDESGDEVPPASRETSPPPPPPPAPPPPPPAAPSQAAETPMGEAETEETPAPAARPEREPPLMETVEYTASAGAEFRVELVDSLSTRGARPGDRFLTRSIDPIVEGSVVIVTGESPIWGHITAVQPSGGQGQAAVLKVAFDSVRVEGRWFPLSASIVEANPETRGRQSTAEKAAKIGGGAVAGAILGRVIGGNATGTVVGAAVGAAAGTAIVLGTEDVDAVLPEGSVLRLRLDRMLTVSVDRPGG